MPCLVLQSYMRKNERMAQGPKPHSYGGAVPKGLEESLFAWDPTSHHITKGEQGAFSIFFPSGLIRYPQNHFPFQGIHDSWGVCTRNQIPFPKSKTLHNFRWNILYLIMNWGGDLMGNSRKQLEGISPTVDCDKEGCPMIPQAILVGKEWW